VRTIFKEIRVSTKERVELIDMTRDVESIVERSSISEGLCLVQSLHSTAAIVVNEHESGLMQDIVKKVQMDFPKTAGWRHDLIDDNAYAHLATTYLGFSKCLAVRNGRLVRGTWQNIFLVELDGPRERTVLIEVLGK